MDLFAELQSIVRSLDDANVPYAIAGGLAVAIWGAPRATKDIDLLVLDEDVQRCKAAIAPLGYVLPAEPMTFSNQMTVHRVSKIADGKLMTVDLLIVTPWLQKGFDEREHRTIENGSLWVVSRDALIKMKVAAGRPIDEADIIRLKEIDG